MLAGSSSNYYCHILFGRDAASLLYLEVLSFLPSVYILYSGLISGFLCVSLVSRFNRSLSLSLPPSPSLPQNNLINCPVTGPQSHILSSGREVLLPHCGVKRPVSLQKALQGRELRRHLTPHKRDSPGLGARSWGPLISACLTFPPHLGEAGESSCSLEMHCPAGHWLSHHTSVCPILF